MTARRSTEPAPLEALSELLDTAQEPPGGDAPRAADRPAPRVPRLPAASVRAVGGAVAAVCAVALGLVVLLWLDDAPPSVSAVSRPAASSASMRLPGSVGQAMRVTSASAAYSAVRSSMWAPIPEASREGV